MDAVVGQELIQMAHQTPFLFLIQHTRSDQREDDVVYRSSIDPLSD